MQSRSRSAIQSAHQLIIRTRIIIRGITKFIYIAVYNKVTGQKCPRKYISIVYTKKRNNKIVYIHQLVLRGDELIVYTL